MKCKEVSREKWADNMRLLIETNVGEFYALWQTTMGRLDHQGAICWESERVPEAASVLLDYLIEENERLREENQDLQCDQGIALCESCGHWKMERAEVTK